MDDLFVGVISHTGKLRNSKLIESLLSLTSEVEVAGIGTNSFTDINLKYRTKTEIACKMSHQLMYQKANQRFAWALILEDDAEVDVQKLISLWEKVKNSNFNEATIISCYVGKWSVTRKLKAMDFGYESLYPPDGTVGYFINASAMEIACGRFDFLRPADWPLWSRHVTFFIAPGIVQEMTTSTSLIDPDQIRGNKNQTFYSRIREFCGINYFGYLGFNLNAVSAIWYWVYRQRLIWYFPRFLRGQKSIKLLENIAH